MVDDIETGGGGEEGENYTPQIKKVHLTKATVGEEEDAVTVTEFSKSERSKSERTSLPHHHHRHGRSPSVINAPHLARYQNRALLLSFFIVLIGTCAGIAFLVVGIDGEEQDMQAQFEKQADEVTMSVKATWQEFSIAALWMHETCHASAAHEGSPSKSMGCTRDEFRDYFEYISSSGLSFESVFFAPNVTHEEREAVEEESRTYFAQNPDLGVDYKGFVQAVFNVETGQFEPERLEEKPWYMPQHYMLPIHKTNALFMDNDKSLSKALWPLMDSAIQELKPKISFRLPKYQDLSNYVQFFHPGIKRNEDPRFNSLAVVMVRIYDLLSRAVESKLQNLEVYLYDVTPSASGEEEGEAVGQFMSGVHIDARNGSSVHNIIPETDRLRAQNSTKRYYETEIAIEDRIWLVLVTDPDDTFQGSWKVPIVGAIVMFVASALIAIWFFTSTKRAARIQRIQAQAELEKSRLLESINRDLNNLVEQRLSELRETEKIANEKSRQAEQEKARSESMVQTISMLSHELRTPLQGIIGVTTMSLGDYQSKDTEIIGKPKKEDDGEQTKEDNTVSAITMNSSMNSSHATSLSTSLSSSTPSHERIMENFYTIQASSHLLLTLINNLLDVRKINSGMMEHLELDCLDLGPIVQQCVEAVGPLATLSDVNLSIRPDVMNNMKNHWLAKCDALHVQQVLINLVGNAIKYSCISHSMESGSNSIHINIRRSNLADAHREAAAALCTSVIEGEAIPSGDREVLIVDVRDHGDGIPIEEAHKVFGAFMMLKRHAHKSKEFAQPTGSGLGLQLCTHLVDRMHGCIWGNNCYSPLAANALKEAHVSESDIAGCIFSFYLECPSMVEAQDYISGGVGRPISSFTPTANNDLVRGLSDEVVRIPAERNKVKILLVDDVIINAKVIKQMMKKLGFQHIRCATSGDRALQMLDEDPEYDLVLTDYQMPGMDGLEFSAKAKEFYRNLQKPSPLFVLCTADYSSTLSTRCSEIRIECMLRKPITITDLSQFIEENQAD